jgi:hypothetical protein
MSLHVQLRPVMWNYNKRNYFTVLLLTSIFDRAINLPQIKIYPDGRTHE